MHFLSILAVEADTTDQAIEHAAAFLSEYEGSAYDYYVVGGRWSGLAGGDDVVCAGARRGVFDDVVRRGLAAHAEEYHRIRQQLAGPDARIVVTDPLGLGSDDDEAAAAAFEARVWAGYTEQSEALRSVLHDAQVHTDSRELGLLGWHLIRFGQLLVGGFDSTSYFYDTVERSHHASALYERVAVQPDRQWLVVVDMHN